MCNVTPKRPLICDFPGGTLLLHRSVLQYEFPYTSSLKSAAERDITLLHRQQDFPEPYAIFPLFRGLTVIVLKKCEPTAASGACTDDNQMDPIEKMRIPTRQSTRIPYTDDSDKETNPSFAFRNEFRVSTNSLLANPKSLVTIFKQLYSTLL